jgi:hypothetical protein
MGRGATYVRLDVHRAANPLSNSVGGVAALLVSLKPG